VKTMTPKSEGKAPPASTRTRKPRRLQPRPAHDQHAHRVTTRFSPEEMGRLHAAARRMGRAQVSAVVRALVLDGIAGGPAGREKYAEFGPIQADLAIIVAKLQSTRGWQRVLSTQGADLGTQVENLLREIRHLRLALLGIREEEGER